MNRRWPGWLRIALIVQLVLALLFFWLGWDHTVSLAQGRPTRPGDIAALSLPLVLVLVLGAAALGQWRARRASLARLYALVPFPLALVLYSLIGAI